MRIGDLIVRGRTLCAWVDECERAKTCERCRYCRECAAAWYDSDYPKRLAAFLDVKVTTKQMKRRHGT